MSKRSPIDVETIAADWLNRVMIIALCLAAMGLSIDFAMRKFGDLGLFNSDRGVIAWGVLASGTVNTLICGQFAWSVIKGFGRPTMRGVSTPPPPTQPLTREELIRQAPWTGRGAKNETKPITPASAAGLVGLIALFVIIWRLPEPYRDWLQLGFLATLAVTRVVDLIRNRRTT